MCGIFLNINSLFRLLTSYIGWLKDWGMSYKCLFYLAGGPMVLGSFLLAPTIWMKSVNVDMNGENSVVLMNEPNLDVNNELDSEVQKLTVL